MIKYIYRFPNLAALAATAFDNDRAKWKTDEAGSVILHNGNPVMVNPDGSEQTVELGTIAQLRREAKTHREAKETAEAIARKFEGIDDPAAARDAIAKLAQIDQGQLIAAGKVDEVRQQITSQFQTQLDAANAKNAELQNKFDTSQIENFFASSDFIRDRVAVPADMFQATFRDRFKVEDGKLNAYYPDGNRVLNKQGYDATPQEAIEMLVEKHPHKDAILKADTGNGSGGNGNGGNRGAGRRMSRAEFQKLNPAQAADAAAKQRSGELTITD